MSLILEALKKSEAQRRLGEMPDLGTPITATRRRRSPLPWLAFAVVLALAAFAAWRWLRPTAPQTVVTSASEQARTKAAPALEPAMRVTPSPVTTSQRAAPKPMAPPPPSPPQIATPPAVRTETAATAPAPAAAAPAPRPIVLPPPAPAAAEAPAPAAVATTPVPPPVANDVPTVDELPPDVRAALPPLPITMQVYSPDPKRRFVIIDGTRVTEGESVRGVTVQEIRQSGLVLEFHGHRALLRPGS